MDQVVEKDDNEKPNNDVPFRTIVATAAAFAFSGFLSILVLKIIFYTNGPLTHNIVLLIVILSTRYYLLVTDESLKTQEKVCLFLFVMYDRDLLDVYNVVLLLGVECLRMQINQSPKVKELISFAIGLIFMLTGWFNVGRVLVIFNFTIVLVVALALILNATVSGLAYIFPKLSTPC